MQKNKILHKSIARKRKFFQRKQRTSLCFPYLSHDPDDVLSGPHKAYDLYLVGSNWEANRCLPVVYVYGCNDWKFGFIAHYLRKYRCAFIPRKCSLVKFLLIQNVFGLDEEVSNQIFIWGYTESWFTKILVGLLGMEIVRMEDGFIRSQQYGREHSLPSSLVFDGKRLYYDCRGPSDLEDLLNCYALEEHNGLRNEARSLIEVIKRHSISKYNPALVYIANGVTPNAIGVVGQVISDAALKYGNPAKVSVEDLIFKAHFENPGKMVFYRPHPDDYNRIIRKKGFLKRIADFAYISSPSEPIRSFFDKVTHIYTINSLSGLEALIFGKKVTVFGQAFYSGWGLTDDRLQIPRRSRTLSLVELVAICYIVFPRYFTGQPGSLSGVLSSIYRVISERNLSLAKLSRKESYSKLGIHSHPTFWALPILRGCLSSRNLREYFFSGRLQRYFPRSEQAQFDYQAFILLGASALTDKKDKTAFFEVFRQVIGPINFKSVIELLYRVQPQNYLAKYFAGLITDSADFDQLLEIPFPLVDFSISSVEKNDLSLFFQKNKIFEIYLPTVTSESSVCDDYLDLIYQQLLGLVEGSQLKSALNIGLVLLCLRHKTRNVLLICAQVLYRLQRFEEAIGVLKLGQAIGFDKSNYRFLYEEFKVRKYLHLDLVEDDKDFLSQLVYFRPEQVYNAIAYIKARSGKSIKLDFSGFEESLKQLVRYHINPSPGKISALFSIGAFEEALSESKFLLDSRPSDISANILYSQALTYSGCIDLACDLVKRLISRNGLQQTLVREALRVYVLAGKFDLATDLIASCDLCGVNVGEMHKRKTYFGAGALDKAFATFREIKLKSLLAKAFPNRVLKNVDDIDKPIRSLLLISIYGPGDEIRFASIYRWIISHFRDLDLHISCDPRLIKLFSRAFPEVNFIPVKRARTYDLINRSNYSLVPDFELYPILDNVGVKALVRADAVTLVTDLLVTALPKFESFQRTSYFHADPELVEEFRCRLSKYANKRLVGFSWRSSLQSHARDEHYLELEECESLFELDDILFVNLQYDDCLDELSAIEHRFPGKLLNFADIDQYNDFNRVSALMSCLDLVIAPATTVAELSGALGCPTWLFSNSHELDWRKIDSSGSDVWYSSCRILDTMNKRSKSDLVNVIRGELVNYFALSHVSKH